MNGAMFDMRASRDELATADIAMLRADLYRALWIQTGMIERAKKSRGRITLRHSRESGNLLRRFHKEKRADIADGRLRIPAFERVKKLNPPTILRHSRERACEEIGQIYKYSSFPRKRESVAAFP